MQLSREKDRQPCSIDRQGQKKGKSVVEGGRDGAQDVYKTRGCPWRGREDVEKARQGHAVRCAVLKHFAGPLIPQKAFPLNTARNIAKKFPSGVLKTLKDTQILPIR